MLRVFCCPHPSDYNIRYGAYRRSSRWSTSRWNRFSAKPNCFTPAFRFNGADYIPRSSMDSP